MLKQLGIGLAVLFLAMQVATGGGEKGDKGLEGTWQATKAVENGNANPKPENFHMIFKGDTFTITEGDQVKVNGTFKVDATKKPGHIDMKIEKGPTGGDNGKTVVGIYKIEGKTLTWCAAKIGTDNRPTDFACEAGSSRILGIFQRAKAK